MSTKAKQIRSRNSLFRGQFVRKPKPALVVGYDPDGWEIYACPHCGHQATAEECDALGAEPCCAFCPKCSGEFEL